MDKDHWEDISHHIYGREGVRGLCRCAREEDHSDHRSAEDETDGRNSLVEEARLLLESDLQGEAKARER